MIKFGCVDRDEEFEQAVADLTVCKLLEMDCSCRDCKLRYLTTVFAAALSDCCDALTATEHGLN